MALGLDANEFLFSKETVVLRRYESGMGNCGFLRRVQKDQIKIVIDVRANDEGLTIEMSAFPVFLGVNSTLINSFAETKFSSTGVLVA